MSDNYNSRSTTIKIPDFGQKRINYPSWKEKYYKAKVGGLDGNRSADKEAENAHQEGEDKSHSSIKGGYG
jgi:hypothetical protein